VHSRPPALQKSISTSSRHGKPNESRLGSPRSSAACASIVAPLGNPIRLHAADHPIRYQRAGGRSDSSAFVLAKCTARTRARAATHFRYSDPPCDRRSLEPRRVNRSWCTRPKSRSASKRLCGRTTSEYFRPWRVRRARRPARGATARKAQLTQRRPSSST